MGVWEMNGAIAFILIVVCFGYLVIDWLERK